ncbi:Copia protein [Porphyridium purpureum]|uniref:Copia protein n=1 Tax=Porphyridium purpureum TaxID=35688 RepID=A0A5J4YT78_PORPP|nr:Copia protein [Porphyridium purpureum]|eukprot:POR2660..scf227_4
MYAPRRRLRQLQEAATCMEYLTLQSRSTACRRNSKVLTRSYSPQQVPNATSEPVQTERSFTKREIKRAAEAMELQRCLGYPSIDVVKTMLRRGDIEHCDFTVADIDRAVCIWGKDVSRIKGKTTGHKTPVVRIVPQRTESVAQEMHCDLMFLEGYTFVITVVKPMHFIITTMAKGKTAKDMSAAMKKQVAFLKAHRIDVRAVKTDPESGLLAIVEELSETGILLNQTASAEAVPAVERAIRTVKEIARSTLYSLPFALPKELLPQLVQYSTHRCNIVPGTTGWHDAETPMSRMTGVKASMKRDLALKFGDYVQAESAKVDNSLKARTVGCIALYPVGNVEGSWVLLNLNSMRETRRQRWQKLSIPEEVISYLNGFKGTISLLRDNEADALTDSENEIETASAQEYPRSQGALSMSHTGPIKGTGEQLGGEQSAASTGPESQHAETPRHAVQAGSDRETSCLPAEAGGGEGMLALPLQVGSAENVAVPPMEQDTENTGGTRDVQVQPRPREGMCDEMNPVDSCNDQDLGDIKLGNMSVSDVPVRSNGTMDSALIIRDITSRLPPVPSRGAKRARFVQSCDDTGIRSSKKRRTFRAMWRLVKKSKCLSAIVRKAYTEYGTSGLRAVINELMQMSAWDKDVLEPITRKLTDDEKRSLLPAHMILDEKRNPQTNEVVKIKARLVAGGHRQERELFPDSASPTVSTEALRSLAALAAHERRKVATVDFPGAYLNVSMPEEGPQVFVRLDRELSSVMVAIDPELEQAVGQSGTMICRLKKAMYGCITSAKLWYNHLVKDLQDIGFMVCVNDPCVLKRAEDDMWLVVHVDDIKLFAKNCEDIARLSDELKARYQGLKVCINQTLEYLGLVFRYDDMGHVEVSMPAFTDRLLSEANVTGSAKTPATDNLFDVYANSQSLSQKEKATFHTLVAKLLYLAKRIRPKLLLVTSHLTRRVIAQNADDQAKLNRALKYLARTREQVLRLGVKTCAEGHVEVSIFVDAAFGVHSDMHSHTGCVVSLGRGAVYAKSSRQKLVTKSSTEAELVGVSDMMGQSIWIAALLTELDVDVKRKVLYQDNEATMALIRNGRPNSFRTRHIALRYFFTSDRISRGELDLKHCPTELMWADVLTKPVQGKLFQKLRAWMLGAEETP